MNKIRKVLYYPDGRVFGFAMSNGGVYAYNDSKLNGIGIEIKRMLDKEYK